MPDGAAQFDGGTGHDVLIGGAETTMMEAGFPMFGA
jgi:hypothetical protein